MERTLIFDVGPVEPCGCRWHLWAEGAVWHVGAACARCQDEILKMVQQLYPDVRVTEGD